MKFLKELLPIALCLLIIGGSVSILLLFVKGYPSSNLTDWADFATYLSVSLSLISVIFIYLTYKSQINMSSVLQFESTFFQWYQIHNDLLKDLKPLISESVANVIMPRLKKADFSNLSVFEELARKDIPRSLHRYYKSMYQLLRYIEISPILSYYSQRKKYYDIIQANMTDDELILFLCFVLGDVNRDKKVVHGVFNHESFKELVDKAHILKNCYIGDEELHLKMTPIVRSSFPETAIKSFHFFKPLPTVDED